MGLACYAGQNVCVCYQRQDFGEEIWEQRCSLEKLIKQEGTCKHDIRDHGCRASFAMMIMF